MAKKTNPYLQKYGHCCTIGQTESGKTLLNQALSRWYGKYDIKRIVFDPMADPDWGADEMFDDVDEFLRYVKDPRLCTGAALFLDESGNIDGTNIRAARWLTTQGRHHGHVVHILSQRAEMVDKTMREQCRTLFAFNVCADDAKSYAKSWNNDDVLKAPTLGQGRAIQATRFEPTKYWKMW